MVTAMLKLQLIVLQQLSAGSDCSVHWGGMLVYNTHLAMRVSLTLCMLGNLSSAKMSSAKFLKLAFSSIFFSKNTIRIANSFDPDETPRFVASHLDPNCLQMPSKFGSSTERVKHINFSSIASEA